MKENEWGMKEEESERERTSRYKLSWKQEEREKNWDAGRLSPSFSLYLFFHFLFHLLLYSLTVKKKRRREGRKEKRDPEKIYNNYYHDQVKCNRSKKKNLQLRSLPLVSLSLSWFPLLLNSLSLSLSRGVESWPGGSSGEKNNHTWKKWGWITNSNLHILPLSLSHSSSFFLYFSHFLNWNFFRNEKNRNEETNNEKNEGTRKKNEKREGTRKKNEKRERTRKKNEKREGRRLVLQVDGNQESNQSEKDWRVIERKSE